MAWGLLGVVVVVVLAIAVVAFFRSIAEERSRAAEAEVQRLQNLLDEVKELAWSNREIAPDQATIIIDTIRLNERGDRRRELP
jgi:hypothetical protein